MNNKLIGALSYLIFFAPSLFGRQNDSFLAYHSRQGLGLLVAALAMQGIISIAGYWGFPQYMLAWLVRFILLYLVIVGAMTAMNGNSKPLPWIGKYSEKI